MTTDGYVIKAGGSMPLTKDEASLAQRIQGDGVGFFKQILGVHPHKAQQRLIEAVARHDPRISVSGANGTGKDWTTGRIILWWMLAHYPAKVIVTGPTGTQVKDIVFMELRHAYRTAAFDCGGYMLPIAPRLLLPLRLR